MRADLELIQKWIEPDTRVLDLGCGDGELLAHLKKAKNIRDCGLEIDNDYINQCLRRGVNVIQQDIDQGLANFDSGSFDTVLLAQTLQAVRHPDLLIEEMLRVGKRCILTFPNFGYWRYRFEIMLQGRMPVSKSLPYEWYDTPNIHFCTIKDFDIFCRERNIEVLERTVVDFDHRINTLMDLNPNFFGINAIYHISR